MTEREKVIYRWNQDLGDYYSDIYDEMIKENPVMLDIHNIGTDFRVVDLKYLRQNILNGKY